MKEITCHVSHSYLYKITLGLYLISFYLFVDVNCSLCTKSSARPCQNCCNSSLVRFVSVLSWPTKSTWSQSCFVGVTCHTPFWFLSVASTYFWLNGCCEEMTETSPSFSLHSFSLALPITLAVTVNGKKRFKSAFVYQIDLYA